MSALWPRQCMTTYGTRAAATKGTMAGSARPPLTSLTARAPAASAASATPARIVSMLTTAPAPASSRTTGNTLRSSSSTGTRSAPGRVDSPPTSRMSAPSASSRSPCAIASSAAKKAPPSENESGVTLITPMTRHRSRAGRPGTTGRRNEVEELATAASLRKAAPSLAEGHPMPNPLAWGGLMPTADRCSAARRAFDDQAHRLVAGRGLAEQNASHGRGDGLRPGLADPPHRHAQVLGLDHDDGALRLEYVHQRIGELRCQPLLDLRPPRVHVDEPG